MTLTATKFQTNRSWFLPKVLLTAIMILTITFSPKLIAACGDSLVDTIHGDVPILITAPHGGMDKNNSIREVCDPLGGGARCNPDWQTYNIAKVLRDELHGLLGVRPYSVLAKFHRGYIDGNRKPEKDAYNSDDECAKDTYDAYHSTIEEYISEINERWPEGILLDIHGQSKKDQKSTVHRGTNNLVHVSGLIQKHGIESITGPNSIFGYLAQVVNAKEFKKGRMKNFKVYPDSVGQSEDSDLNANGGTARWYGAHENNIYDDPERGINTMGVEIGRYLRLNDAKHESLKEACTGEGDCPYEQLAKVLARAIAVFYSAYFSDCVPIRHPLRVRWKSNNFIVVDSNNHVFGYFGSKWLEARKTMNIIRHYKLDQMCYVGRPDPSLKYSLVKGDAPRRAWRKEDCVPFNPKTINATKKGKKWYLMDGNYSLFSFGNKEHEARGAVEVIKRHRFTRSCFVGRPDPSFSYFRR